jgi:alpha-ketoglutarate-dependent taurine dioxygenase
MPNWCEHKDRDMSKISVEPMTKHVGAKIHVDRSNLFDADVAADSLSALEDRGVIIFPGLHLTDEEQLRFTDGLGDRVDFTKNAPGGNAAEQDVYKITLDPEVNQHQEYVLGTFFWHVDGATMDMALPKATLLSARVLSDKGGQTEFCNLYAAYEYLPDHLKADYADMRVLHTIGSSMREVVEEVNEESVVLLNTASKMNHPLVWTHQSGRKSLLLGSHADRIFDMPLAQGRAIIRRLTEWAAQPDFIYSHEWEPGDFVIWDNCGVMHRVNPYDDPRRTMHRTTLAGHERVS